MPVEHMKDIPYIGKLSWRRQLCCHPPACSLEALASVPGPTVRKNNRVDGKTTNEKMSRAFPSVASTSVLNQT